MSPPPSPPLPGPLGRSVVVGAPLVALAAIILGLRIDEPRSFLLYLAGLLAVALSTRAGLARIGRPALLSDAWARHAPWGRFALAVAVVAFPFIFTLGFKNPYWVYVATLAGIYICLALGLNIVVGLAGLLDLGYVAFYAIGAYTSALVSIHFPDSWWALWLWLPGCIGSAALLGILLGFPTLRLRGDYLAIVTLGFGEIIRVILNNWDGVTNGPKGLANIPSPRLGSYALSDGLPWFNRLVGANAWTKEVNYYLLTVAYAAVIAVVAGRLDGSRVGRAWRALREDELAAKAMGIDTVQVKLLAFGIGASFAGIAGLLFAHMQTFIDPMSFVFMESAIILCMVVLGGMGSIPGVVTGAIVLSVLPEKLRAFQDTRMLVFGLALVVMMILRPQGLLPPRRRAASPT